MALTDTAHDIIRAQFTDRDGIRRPAMNLAIDATCGNGHDTLFLAQLKFKTVIGFDIQSQAIENTRQRLRNAGIDSVRLYQTGHEHLGRHVTQAIDCVVFNFGYLPSANKAISTSKEHSLMAIESALAHLAPLGIVTLICYPGHSTGLQETTAIQQWLIGLTDQWTVKTYPSESPSNRTPILYTIHRTGAKR
jgi:methylase of polypeptide subunit release factors